MPTVYLPVVPDTRIDPTDDPYVPEITKFTEMVVLSNDDIRRYGDDILRYLFSCAPAPVSDYVMNFISNAATGSSRPLIDIALSQVTYSVSEHLRGISNARS